MAKKKRQRKEEKEEKRFKPKNKMKLPKIYLPEETKNWIWGILIFIFAAIFVLSFFNSAGPAGQHLKNLFLLLIGKAVYLLPVVFILGGLVFFITKYKKFYWPTVLAIFIIILGTCGILEGIKPHSEPFFGGWIGYLVASPILKFLGWKVNYIVFGAFVFFGILIFWYLLKTHSVIKEQEEEKSEKKIIKEKIKTTEEVFNKPSLIKQIFSPKLKVTGIGDEVPIHENKPIDQTKNFPSIELKNKEIGVKPLAFAYQAPTIELLDSGKETPTSGDIKTNSAIIKKTLQNFDIPVEMSEVNIGPAVTQYTFKPAEGVKLSKITGLSNDLSLSLAAHPIRIEAPIPGRSLVGIEVPNRIRAKVRFKDLASNPIFQTSPSVLNLALGRDVSGAPAYTDLSKMPHLLVAGSTGSGKTIFLNTLILSLIYRNSPELLNLILIDPKSRVPRL
jgi:S-DNA-T family DNA segregation ATPase FtsK/SpoIIIE